MAWIGGLCVFVVDTIFKTGESLMVMQRAFWAHFIFNMNDTVLDRIFYQEQHHSDGT